MTTKFVPDPEIAKLETELDAAFSEKRLEDVNRLSAAILELRKDDEKRLRWYEENREDMAFHVEKIRSAITAIDLKEALEGAMIAFGFHKSPRIEMRKGGRRSKHAKHVFGKVGETFYELIGGKAKEIAPKRGRIKTYASLEAFEKQ